VQHLRLRCIQEFIKSEYFKKDSERGLFATFTWLVEEVGELAEALLSGNKESVEEELADILAWTISVANLVNVDVEKAFLKKYSSAFKCLEGSSLRQ